MFLRYQTKAASAGVHGVCLTFVRSLCAFFFLF
jgi:hypothetical protein